MPTRRQPTKRAAVPPPVRCWAVQGKLEDGTPYIVGDPWLCPTRKRALAMMRGWGHGYGKRKFRVVRGTFTADKPKRGKM